MEVAYRCKDKSCFDIFVFITAKQNILTPGGIREVRPAARTLDEFLNETAHVLQEPGIAKLASESKRRALLDALREKRALLIYDNLETLTREEQEAIADFLRSLPLGCKALITSRRRGGEGAVWLRLEKLEWEAARALIESEMARDLQLAHKLRSVDASRWQELYDETKGSPLALVHTLGLMRVRAALTFDGALEMLRGNRAPDVQEFIFQEARRELTSNDETALRALSFFATSAAFEAWIEVARLSRSALEATSDRLSALSLVDVLAGGERFALNPLTRQFVRDTLVADVEVTRELGERFAEYWVTYAEQHCRKSYVSYRHLEAEWPNLAAAASWLRHTMMADRDVPDRDSARSVNALASSLSSFLFFSGRWDEQLELNAWAYEAMQKSANWSASGWRAHIQGWIYLERGDTDEAAHWLNRCDEAWSRAGRSQERVADVIHLRGLIARERHDFEGARRLLGDTVMIYRDLRLDDDLSRVLISLGNLEKEVKAYEAAQRYLLESLEIEKKLDSRTGMAVSVAALGDLAVERQRWDEARDLCEEALRLAREVCRQDLIAGVAYDLALVHESQGHPDLALSLAREALRIEGHLRGKELAKRKELAERLESILGRQG